MPKSTRDRLLYGIAAILALAPLPLGGNRPFFASMDGVMVAAVTLLFLAGKERRSSAPLAMRGLVPLILIAAAIAWMGLQLLPLPDQVAPEAWTQARLALGERVLGRLSVDPAATVGMIVHYLSYALLFFLVVEVGRDPARARRLLVIVFWLTVAQASYAIVALYGLGDTLLAMPKWAYEGYATGTFVNRNSLATFLGFGVVGGVALLLDDLGLLRRREANAGGVPFRALDAAGVALPVAAGLAVLCSGIVLSGSRMGAAATLAGATTAFALALARQGAPRPRLVLGLGVAAAAIVGIVALSGASLLERLGSVETSADERLRLYRQVVQMIAERPLTGYGGGAFADAFQSFHRLPLSADVTWDAAHNLYLELFADLGVVGLAPILAVAWIFVFLVGAAVTGRHPTAAIAGAAAIVLAAIHSLVDFSLQIEADVFAFLAIVAAGFAGAMRHNGSESQASRRRIAPTDDAPQGALARGP